MHSVFIDIIHTDWEVGFLIISFSIGIANPDPSSPHPVLNDKVERA